MMRRATYGNHQTSLLIPKQYAVPSPVGQICPIYDSRPGEPGVWNLLWIDELPAAFNLRIPRAAHGSSDAPRRTVLSS